MGAVPWICDRLSPIVESKPTMVCGLNQYYDAANTGCCGVIGLVASYNKTCTRWWSGAEVLDPEWPGNVAVGLQTLMMKAIKNFKSVNGCLPGRLILYREGIRADQAIAQAEVQMIEAAFKEEDAQIELCYVHVN